MANSNPGGQAPSPILQPGQQPARRGIPPAPSAFHTLAKPIGPICNLDCTYCFYLHKENIFPSATNYRMSDEVLETFVQQYIEGQDVPEINFAWQGGEPTLLGVEFFKRALEFQKKYAPKGKTITNAFQTNGVLLDDEWAAFLKENDFLIGLSIDGPKRLHDKYRVDKHGGSSFDDVMRGLRFLQKHDVRVNSLTCVNRETANHGAEVYRFLRDECQFEHMQFIPIVEKTDFETVAPGVENPEGPSPKDDLLKVTPWTVKPEQFGRFLSAVFDEWARADVGKVFVQTFEQTLAGVLGVPASLCIFRKTCGKALAIEHDGGLFSCDHFVYGEYKLGNIKDKTMRQMAQSDQQEKFGNDKYDKLPRFCRTCDFLSLCYGECPKNRFIKTPDGEEGLNYLCAGYKIYFAHVTPVMSMMAKEIREGRPADGIMRAMQAAEQVAQAGAAKEPAASKGPPAQPKALRPNDRCACGSGKKYKKCCGR